jgi:peptidoglycan/xylan/chitin deacetylase (PgdA/CDA1 family)
VRGQELILTFHGLEGNGAGPPPGASEAERKVWVPREWLEAILDALPRAGVAVAFDDGNASDAEQALAPLAKRGASARFFVLAGKIGAPGHLTAAQIATLHEAGMTIGSHGLHHRDWRALSDEQLHEELVGSRRALEELLGSPVQEAACPFGSYDRRVLRALRAAGYRRVYSSDGGCAPTRAWLAARSTVHRERSLEQWVALAAAGARERPNPTRLGKRLIKRLR